LYSKIANRNAFAILQQYGLTLVSPPQLLAITVFFFFSPVTSFTQVHFMNWCILPRDAKRHNARYICHSVFGIRSRNERHYEWWPGTLFTDAM